MGVNQFLPPIEKNIINFWLQNKVFEKVLKKNKGKKVYSFYDGPPFASGSPHYGHIMVSFIKDIIRRYWTLAGFNVEQTFGWDCHGLPVELYVEKKLNIKSKKDILNLGKNQLESIKKFNRACKSSVFDCIGEWYAMFKRIGRWGDFKNAYVTMDNKFIESVWWIFQKIWEKNLIYQDYKSMHICPRCETPLSNFEVSLGYKEITDLSVTVKFELKDEPNTYFLAWTTTPWSLFTTMGLAVGTNIDYVKVSTNQGNYILAEKRLEEVFKNTNLEFKITDRFKAGKILNKKYKHLFDFYNKRQEVLTSENVFTALAGDYVLDEEGTGIATINGAYGEIDMEQAKKYQLPIILNVKTDGTFTEETKGFEGKFCRFQDEAISQHLLRRGLLFSKQNFLHSYPHCWRCDTPLLNYATKAWLIKVTAFKNQLTKANQKINWVPEHIKNGRFGEWLREARDWVVSRNRFWGAPLPVWVCQTQTGKTQNYSRSFDDDNQKICNNIVVIGSVKELEKLSGKKLNDLHRPFIDEITFKCEKCRGIMKRVEEVLDCWFESGSMPYGQHHFPFENKKKFEKTFPADFITESLDQTRGWFYTLHVLSTALFNQPSFKNVIVGGLILDEQGRKLSKKLKNYPDPDVVFEKYGADALRYFLIKNTVPGENTRFNEELLKESQKELIFPILNSINFFKTVSEVKSYGLRKSIMKNSNILDQWLEAKLASCLADVNNSMENYNLRESLQLITEFVNNDLNNWYIKLSRERLKFEEKPLVLGRALLNLCIVTAPFIPFVAEYIYQELKKTFLKKHCSFKLSVFLENMATPKPINKKQLAEMEAIRRVVSIGWRIRKENNLPLRLPLYSVCANKKIKIEYHDLIKESLNVKQVRGFTQAKRGLTQKKNDITQLQENGLMVGLSTKIDEGLLNEKIIREFIRQINNLRKEKRLTMQDKIKVRIYLENEKIKKLLLANSEKILPKIFAHEIKVIPEPLAGACDFEIENQKISVKF
jgi:isoleucyl-tRNA synthetase